MASKSDCGMILIASQLGRLPQLSSALKHLRHSLTPISAEKGISMSTKSASPQTVAIAKTGTNTCRSLATAAAAPSCSFLPPNCRRNYESQVAGFQRRL